MCLSEVKVSKLLFVNLLVDINLFEGENKISSEFKISRANLCFFSYISNRDLIKLKDEIIALQSGN